MQSNDLPIYPTPQQAAYIQGNQSSASVRSHGQISQHPPNYRVVPAPGHTYQQNKTLASHHNLPAAQYGHDYQQQYYQQSNQHHPMHQDSQYYSQQGRPPPPPMGSSHIPPGPPPHHNYYSQYQEPPPPAPTGVQPAHPQHAPRQRPNYAGPIDNQMTSQHQSMPDTHIGHNSNNAKKVIPSNGFAGSKEALVEKPSKQKLSSELRAVFDKVDKNRSGKISANELSAALLNFDNTRFQSSAILLMIKLFGSTTSSGTARSLNFEQFVSLWKYLSTYKKLFIQADVNKSGDISFGEFQKILEQIGYKLNVDTVLHLYLKFAYKSSDIDYSGGIAVGTLKFDSFIELLVYLRKLTDVFKKYDSDFTGVATINFMDFLVEVTNLS